MSYPAVLPKWFVTSRLDPASESLMKTAFEGIIKASGEKTKVCCLPKILLLLTQSRFCLKIVDQNKNVYCLAYTQLQCADVRVLLHHMLFCV